MTNRRVQFAETDAAGVLHFSNYFRMMEEAEHAFWRSLELSVVVSEGGRCISWPRVSVSCEYFAPAHFEDELALQLALTELGERSMSYRVEFRRDGRRTALGITKAVCCTMADGAFRPVAIPEVIRAKLLPFVIGAG
jgi:4-hydroxybenzoyl-CoA thioesterase/acyl-CoA thioester hydrolase